MLFQYSESFYFEAKSVNKDSPITKPQQKPTNQTKDITGISTEQNPAKLGICDNVLLAWDVVIIICRSFLCVYWTTYLVRQLLPYKWQLSNASWTTAELEFTSTSLNDKTEIWRI